MTKGKRKRKKGGGGGPAVPNRETILGELAVVAREIAENETGAIGPQWGQAHKLLIKAKVDAHEVGAIIASRDVEHLQRVVRVLQGHEEPADAAAEPVPPAADAPEIPADTLKKAMRAFRNRVKVMRLDHESKLGRSPMTGGKKADFDAIIPPQEFPREVWNKLAEDGKLRDIGQGFFMLND